MPDGTAYNRLQFAADVVDHVGAMLAYWDRDLICRFANKAYLQWFGKSQDEMVDKMKMPELLGPLFENDMPYVREALNGERQTFERETQTLSGSRHSLTNYYPDTSDGEVLGFYVQLADITVTKNLLQERENLIGKLQIALNEISNLTGLLPICAWCKSVRDDEGYWSKIETYISSHSSLKFTHSICESCAVQFRANAEFKAEGVLTS